MASKRQISILSYLTFLTQCSVTLAVNFDTCLDVLETLPINCSDPNFFCPNGERPQGNKTFITRRGCESFCGQGYDLDPTDDIIIRFILWLLPVLVLAAHFQFPALGWTNTMTVCWGLLGNPIGSLYAMLTRVEMGRSSCSRAVAAGFTNNKAEEANSIPHPSPHLLEADTAADVAAICLSCDEFGWHDPLDEIVRHLRVPSGHLSSGEHNQAGRPLLSLKQILYLAECRHDLISHRSDSQSGTTFAIIGLVGAVCSGFIKSWMDRHKLWSSRTIPMVILSYHVIALVRISGIVGAFTSVFGPLLALQKLQRRFKILGDQAKQDGTIDKGPIGRSDGEGVPPKPKEHEEKKPGETVTTKDERNASDKEDVSRKTSWLLSLDLEPDTIWKKMKSHHQPSISLRRSPTSSQEEGRDGYSEKNENQLFISKEGSALTLSKPWLETAGYLGMNPTWRPYNLQNPWNLPDQRLVLAWKPLVLAFLFVTISWLFAFLHSYFYVPRPGFGCRSLTWTMIYCAWLLSFVIDFTFKYPRLFRIQSYERLWRWTSIKDVVISLLIIPTIIITHIGLQNTCYCKSGTLLGDKYIDLNPSDSVAMWVEMGTTAFGGLGIMLSLMYFAGYFGDRARSVLSPSRDERRVIQLRLQRLRNMVEEEGQTQKERTSTDSVKEAAGQQ